MVRWRGQGLDDILLLVFGNFFESPKNWIGWSPDLGIDPLNCRIVMTLPVLENVGERI